MNVLLLKEPALFRIQQNISLYASILALEVVVLHGIVRLFLDDRDHGVVHTIPDNQRLFRVCRIDTCFQDLFDGPLKSISDQQKIPW